MRNTNILLLVAGILCFLLALFMAALAFSGVAGAATNIAWLLFVFLLLCGGALMLLSLILHLRTPRQRIASS